MVDPDVGRELDTEGITVRGEDFGDGDVSDDDVCSGLTSLEYCQLVYEGRVNGNVVTYSPKPVSLAAELLPMMLILLPTFT